MSKDRKEPTKGEWTMDEFDGKIYILGPKVKGKDGVKMPVYLAEIVTEDTEGLYVKTRAERLANAHLFTASKDLREALVGLMGNRLPPSEDDPKGPGSITDNWNKAIRALAKARGE